MDHSEFVAEGTLDVGPSAQYFVFLDGEYLGQRVVEHFKWNTSNSPKNAATPDWLACASL